MKLFDMKFLISVIIFFVSMNTLGLSANSPESKLRKSPRNSPRTSTRTSPKISPGMSNAKPEKLLVVHPRSGMGNRLMFLASAAALAKQTGRKLILQWDKDDQVPADFDEIFSSPKLPKLRETYPDIIDPAPNLICTFRIASKIPKDFSSSSRPVIVNKDGKLFSYAFFDGKLDINEIPLKEVDPLNMKNLHWLYEAKKNQEFQLHYTDCDFFIDTGAHSPGISGTSLYLAYTKRVDKIRFDKNPIVYLKYFAALIPKDEKLEEFIFDYLNFYKELIPSDLIANRVTEFYNQYMKEREMVGVHFRSWNANVENQFWANQRLIRPDLEEFKNEMTEILVQNPNAMFFVAGDDAKSINELELAFPGKVLKYLQKQARRESTEDIQDAIVEWFLLQKTNHIIGTRQSTFSDEASIFTKEHRKTEVGPYVFPLEKRTPWEGVSKLLEGTKMLVIRTESTEYLIDCKMTNEFPALIRGSGDHYWICTAQDEGPTKVTHPEDEKRLTLELDRNRVYYGKSTIVNVYIKQILEKYGHKFTGASERFFQ